MRAIGHDDCPKVMIDQGQVVLTDPRLQNKSTHYAHFERNAFMCIMPSALSVEATWHPKLHVHAVPYHGTVEALKCMPIDDQQIASWCWTDFLCHYLLMHLKLRSTDG